MENETKIEKAFSMDDICKLTSHLYKSEDNYISAYDTSLVDSTNAFASSALLTSLQGSFSFKLDSEIIKIKTYPTFILALCKNGVMYKIDRNNPSIQKSKNVLDVIKMNYVYNKFDIYSIIDFDYYSNGVLLATSHNGIFYVSIYDNNSSVACQELYVSKIKVLPDRKTLLITKISDKNNVVLFNLELGTKLAVYNQMGIYHQVAQSIHIGDGEFFILGRSSAINQDDNLIHHWKLDEAGIAYENLDNYIAKNPCDNTYRPKLIKAYNSAVYVIGTKEKKLFVWEYDKENMNTRPIELLFNLQDFEYDDIKDFVNIANKYYITLTTQILVLDNNFTLLENYQLNGKQQFTSSKITTSGIYAIAGNEAYSFYIPEKVYQKTIDINVLNNEICNNMDILIKAGKDNTVIFIDGDTAQRIIPYHYIKLDGKFHIIKLKDFQNTNILMRIGIAGETEKIHGLVIHKNRIFYKNV